ncbi:MAG TPA: hypothetical protein VML95_11055 [Longimicrobiales bacterium]|nr:hypothetical protein [Longimicrobiales bacterium]
MQDDLQGGHDSAERPLVSDLYRSAPDAHDQRSLDDGNASLALAIGLVAALAAGGAWALIVLTTGYEIGWVAWGVGLVVGLVMSRLTAARSTGLAAAAAGIAAVGLLVGKLLISTFSVGVVTDAVLEDEEYLTQVTIYHMIEERSFNEGTLADYDAVQEGDTLSDALWDKMVAQARTRVATMTDEERATVASGFAESAIGSMGLSDRIMNQMSGWDLLWFFLAVSTAYSMMKARPEGAAAV